MPAAVDASHDIENGLKLVWPEDPVVDKALEIYINKEGKKEKTNISSVPVMIQKR